MRTIKGQLWFGSLALVLFQSSPNAMEWLEKPSVKLGYSSNVQYIKTDMFGAQRVLNTSYNSETKKTERSAKVIALELLAGTACGVSSAYLLTSPVKSEEALAAAPYLILVLYGATPLSATMGTNAVGKYMRQKGCFLCSWIGAIVGAIVIPEFIHETSNSSSLIIASFGIGSGIGAVIGYNFLNWLLGK